MQHSRFNSVRFAFALQLINTSLHRNTISNKLNKAKEKYIWGEQREKQQKCVTQIYERTEMQKSTLCIKKAAKKFVCCFLVLCNKLSFFFLLMCLYFIDDIQQLGQAPVCGSLRTNIAGVQTCHIYVCAKA